MPGVEVYRLRLLQALGLPPTYTDEQFDELCFEFGIELDEITTDAIRAAKEVDKTLTKAQVKEMLKKAAPEEIKYKIDLPANRYDLLCLESLSDALKTFMEEGKTVAELKAVTPAEPLQMTVLPDTERIRPFVVCAVLRNIKFDAASYRSFIDLQEKLHSNICRKRTLVAIGTHDLDTLSPPFTYEALAPSDIKFAPLNHTQEFTAGDLLEYIAKSVPPQAGAKEGEKGLHHLKPYIDIIRSSPVYPVIYDSKRRVLSLPPIINGNHSKISENTRNVFIECTATDLTKARITLNVICAAFSKYCEKPYEIETVKIVKGDKTCITPDLSPREVSISVEQLNQRIGIKVDAAQTVKLLRRMGMLATADADGQHVRVQVPATRSDILHPVDIYEDVAVAYGFDRIPKTQPKTLTVGKQQPLNKLTDLLRLEMAQAGYTELLTHGLCSHDENYKDLRRADDGLAVSLLNPVTEEYQICRTTLLPGVLKTLASNKGKFTYPVRLFEVSDVVYKDSSIDTGARNERHLVALYSNTSSGFEVLHGVLDALMRALNVPASAYKLVATTADGAYFPGFGVEIMLSGVKLGTMGVLHPEVLRNYGLDMPATALEIRLLPFV